VMLMLAVAIVAWIRLRIADVPLERDEGEYAYDGQLILRDVPPYSLVYNMKFPGTCYTYADSRCLRPDGWRIHAVLLCLDAATSLILFLWADAFLDKWEALWREWHRVSVARSPDHVRFAHATHFVLLRPLAAFQLIVRPAESMRSFVFLGEP
jgi:hypothetical protein